ncbi:L,D-transpeptidase [Lachnobacterium bovis]|uniref:L,D-transpeptidase n=1 Tax=Lachnobacterium bovis TaxID=140626 RepID=UPI0006917B24|nr:L,D-transpeptidase [Lachnobacterium bovis]
MHRDKDIGLKILKIICSAGIIAAMFNVGNLKNVRAEEIKENSNQQDVENGSNLEKEEQLEKSNEESKLYTNEQSDELQSFEEEKDVPRVEPISPVYEGVDYSAVYDYHYYMVNNPDVREEYPYNPSAVFEHFIRFGMSEGRLSSPNFDVKSYKNANPDLRAAFGNNLVKYYKHYVQYGQYENRVATGCETLQKTISSYNGKDYSAVYDYDYYKLHNKDLEKAFGDNDALYIKHFAEFGMNEQRQAKESFDPKSYRYAYPDLRAHFRKNYKMYYEHYINHGLRENRKDTTGVTELRNPLTRVNNEDYSKVYDYHYYIENNPDIKAFYGDDDAGALEHFYKFGMREQRKANDTFDVRSYRYEYMDLRSAFFSDYAQYYRHYIKHGAAEGRHTSGVTSLQGIITKINGIDYSKVYNFHEYINRYPDLKRLYADDDAGAIKHFAEFGMREQRKGNDTFDVRSYRYEYRDLRLIFRNNYPEYYKHYINHGAAEGRHTSGVTTLQNPVTVYGGIELAPIYDYYYYSSHYPDLVGAYGDDDVSLLEHFGGIGIIEGRQAKAQFDQNLYNDVKERLHPTPPPIVGTDAMFNIAQRYSSPSPYLILVDRSRHKVGIFSGSQGRWGEVDYFLCGDGKASTPTVEGLFHIVNKKPYFDSGSARCWYATRIYKGYLFHSVLYTQTSTPTHIKDGRLGVGVSHGCVRLDINKAKWIYDNIPIGTTVVIYS